MTTIVKNNKRKVFWLVLLALLVLLFACGKKTKPVPPNTVLPAATNDLAYHLDEKGVTLSWSYPTRTVSGERLPYRIDSFDLFRAVVPLDKECDGCPIPYGEPITVKADGIKEGKISYKETLLRPKHRYVYRVQSRAGWFVTSERSNTVSLIWDTPLAAPTDLTVEEGDRRLTLTWQAPSSLIDGTAVSGSIRYRVYRATDGENFLPLGSEMDEESYTDKKVLNGKTYTYKVRGIRLFDGTKAAGMASMTQEGVPRDIVAPAAPQFVTVLQVEDGVRILWETLPDADLAGFRIYRRAAGSSTPELLGQVGGASLSFTDSSRPSGVMYYSVSAFDRARPTNESPRSEEVSFGAGR